MISLEAQIIYIKQRICGLKVCTPTEWAKDELETCQAILKSLESLREEEDAS